MRYTAEIGIIMGKIKTQINRPKLIVNTVRIILLSILGVGFPMIAAICYIVCITFNYDHLPSIHKHPSILALSSCFCQAIISILAIAYNAQIFKERNKLEIMESHSRRPLFVASTLISIYRGGVWIYVQCIYYRHIDRITTAYLKFAVGWTIIEGIGYFVMMLGLIITNCINRKRFCKVSR